MKKKNVFLRSLIFILECVEFVILSIIFGVIFILAQPFVWCFTKGKKNVQKDDEARVFIANHYEAYGPFVTFLRFPYKFRPWVIDKMCYAETIEEQFSIGFYNNYKWIPKWIKVIIVKLAKRLILFAIRFAKPIPVSRDNPRANIKTMQISTEVLNKKKNIMIYPENCSVKEGVGEFMTGFEYLAKYYYQKTGKKISFYPVFVSKKNATMYIEKPIIYNPDNDSNLEKQRIVTEIRESMLNSYIVHEKTKTKQK